MTVLLIDDDIDDTLLFKRVLTDINPSSTLLSASDGKEALDYLLKADSRKPDLIFLDLNMPKMNGKECLSILKQSESLSSIPVIIYTTSSLPKDKEETMKAGAICFITKPSSIADLKQILVAINNGFPDNLQTSIEQLNKSGNFQIVC